MWDQRNRSKPRSFHEQRNFQFQPNKDLERQVRLVPTLVIRGLYVVALYEQSGGCATDRKKNVLYVA